MTRMAKYDGWSKAALIKRLVELETIESPGRTELLARPAVADPGEQRSTKKTKQLDFSKYHARKVAIRFAYLGWNYHGLAYQKDPTSPTVESHILAAFHKTKCIPSLDPTECDFSRCGRTDRDVSAMAQVISLNLRSNLTPIEQQDPSMDDRELNYLKILNSHLPPDILAYEICLRPPVDFDARFSCQYRGYRYFFFAEGLDIEAMRVAAGLLVGDHDFRNFCKVDASKQITNFYRRILSTSIEHVKGDLWYFQVRGTAFLWNQVRSLMAILLLVGQGLEKPEIVSKLLDIQSQPRRPAYEIAWGVPLVLYECGYAPMEWTSSPYTRTTDVFNVWHEHWLKSVMAHTMLDVVAPFARGPDAHTNTGRGYGKRGRYVPVADRPQLETPEVVNQRWLDKKERAGTSSSGCSK